MGKEFFKKTADLLQAKHKRKQWQKIVISLSLVVAMITSGLLIHPAITMERNAICGQEEHTHSKECYEKKLICNKEEHTASEVEAAAANGETIEEHKHSDSCYEEVLTCDKKEHKHSEDCYEKETEAKEETTQAASTEETKATAADNTEAAKANDQTADTSKEEEKKTEEVTEETKEEKQEEKAEARTLTAKGEDYTVQVDCPAEAKIPENAELKVREIVKDKESDKEEYEAYYQKAQEALKEKEGEETDISTVRFFDITFMVDGKEIEPAAKVEVKITYDKKVEVSDKGEVKSVHFGDEKTEILDVKTNEENGKMDEITFDATSFSVYGVVGTETLIGDVLTADGKTYTVTVTYGADAKIPEGATLKITEFDENSQDYADAKALVVEKKKAEDENFDESAMGLDALDISIVDKDGKEIEPEAEVDVKIERKSLPEDMDAEALQETMEVQHLDESGDTIAVTTVISSEDTGKITTTDNTVTADFKISSFSKFIITWASTGSSTETSTTLRWRSNYSTLKSVKVYYVDEKNNLIPRPNEIGDNVNRTLSTYSNDIVDINSVLGKSIDGYEYQYAYINDSSNSVVTSITAGRGGKNSNVTLTYSNNDTDYQLNKTYDIYLVYSGGTSLEKQTTIHYGYMNGDDFVEFEKEPSPVEITTSNHAYLIYDFAGYQYADETYYRATEAVNGANMKSGATEIQARLRYNDNNWQYRSNSWNNVANNSHIYVVYEQKPSASTGGAPTAPTDAPDAALPTILKESTPNTDGTSTLALSITGHANDVDPDKLADVIVVLDVSGSMYDNKDMGNDKRRITAAREAVNSLAKTLLEQNTTDNPELFRMALVTFSTSGTTTQGFTTDLSTYQSAVNNVPTGGGTNWEDALEIANQMAVSSDRATFVIFVTDGDPTFRVSRTGATDAQLDMWGKNGNDDYYVSDNVFGEGNDDSQSRNYNAALEVAKSIKAHNKSFYTIGISSDVTNLNNFADAAGADGKYTATTSSDLTKAFEEISKNIKAKVGWGDIKMTDGITQLTSTMEKNNLVEVDGSSFSYWKKAKDATSFVEWDPTSENAQEAIYNSSIGAVEWDMGHNFMPEDGATYKVEFLVWPSQQAYDIIAKLNNGTITYDSLTDAQKAQIIKDGNTYTLVTNCNNPDTTYKRATKSGSSVSTSGATKQLFFNTVSNLGLNVDKLTVKKEWINNLDPDDRWKTEVVMKVKGDGELFKTVTLNESNNWTDYNSFISCGLIKTNSDGTYQVLEKGHDFVIEEPDEYAYYWNFDTNVYRPMIIGTTLTMLVKDDAGTYEIDGNKYRTLNEDEEAATLTATNIRRSNLNLTKVLKNQDDDDITSDSTDLFDFKITVNNINADKGSVDDLNSDYYVWFSVYDPVSKTTVHDLKTDASPEMGNTGYYYAASGSEISVKLQPGWNLRFTNLPTGTTYTIQELLEDGFEFDSAALASGQTSFNITDGTTGSGTIDSPNTQYTVTYTNISKVVDIVVKKTDDKGTASLDGAKFVLQKKNATGTYVQVGEEFTVPANGYEVKSLVPGEYKLEEITPPDGYVIVEQATYFNVNSSGSMNIIELADGTNNAIVSGINNNTITIKNTPGVALPNTGGSGTLPYTLGGLMIMSAAAMMYGFIMRRRGRRLN